jgi:hypothetical protein
MKKKKKTDNVLPLRFDNKSVYSYVEANYIKLVLPSVDLLCCTFLRQIAYMQM